jgi:hypothetical protein
MFGINPLNGCSPGGCPVPLPSSAAQRSFYGVRRVLCLAKPVRVVYEAVKQVLHAETVLSCYVRV